MHIASVEAKSVIIPVEVSPFASSRTSTLTACFVRIETDEGHVGDGLTTLEGGLEAGKLVSGAINNVLAPRLIGQDLLETERIWEEMFWTLSPRGQGGIAFHILSAVDIALWDAIGKSLDKPVAKLMGGARESVPVYATFGFADLDRDELAEAARRTVASGFPRIKMVVGAGALKSRNGKDLESVVREDVARIAAVRSAVGEDPQIYIDANCSLDPYHALRLARASAEYGISWFEEPVSHNDVHALADMRSKIPFPIAVGQNESLLYRFNDLLSSGGVDVVQPNVIRSGGFTHSRKVAAISEVYGRHISNGGGWHLHNLHLLAGVANGFLAEYHHGVVAFYELLYTDIPHPIDGILSVGSKPGLGLTLDWQQLNEYAIS